MKIPIFVSCPTQLNKFQESSKKKILDELENVGLEARTLGTSDYPTEFPLKEVLIMAKHCSGGVILGFEQLWVKKGIWKRDSNGVGSNLEKPISLPTPWNHLEAGILFSLQLPLLVFRENNISGGVFEEGVTDVFINKMPIGRMNKEMKKALHEVILSWYSRVRAKYYSI